MHRVAASPWLTEDQCILGQRVSASLDRGSAYPWIEGPNCPGSRAGCALLDMSLLPLPSSSCAPSIASVVQLSLLDPPLVPLL